MRHYTLADKIINHIDSAVTTLLVKPQVHHRTSPADDVAEGDLTDIDVKHAAGLMRVNHVGEVCAQALYQGQAITARSETVRQKMQQAADEELDHLAWCAKRINELGSHQSYLNFMWYSGALGLGLVAGFIGDRWSLGFLAETESQVCQHLESHFDQLPQEDAKSHAIVEQMHQDEAKHHDMANEEGAAKLPSWIKQTMRCCSKVMTTVAYKI